MGHGSTTQTSKNIRSLGVWNRCDLETMALQGNLMNFRCFLRHFTKIPFSRQHRKSVDYGWWMEQEIARGRACKTIFPMHVGIKSAWIVNRTENYFCLHLFCSMKIKLFHFMFPKKMISIAFILPSSEYNKLLV
jgi:hypothetical protein